jgi:hypothetical protein
MPFRADAALFVGWYSGHEPEVADYDSWYTESVYGGANVGFYWTEHLRTDVEFGITTEDDIQSYDAFELGGQSIFLPVEHTFKTRNLSAGQHYQFFENAWFHPSVGAGIALTWKHEKSVRPSSVPFYPPPASRGISPPGQTVSRDARAHVDVFASTGFKTYVSQRAFFRSDLKVVFGSEVRDLLVRVGFGLDF